MTRDEIKSARTLRKLSQAALGKLTNLSASEISRIECGYRDISEKEAVAIATALGAAQEPAQFVADSPKAVPMGLSRGKKLNAESPSDSPAESATVAPVTPPVAKPLPVGSDLGDPANFGVLPDLSLLTSGGLDAVAYRARLSAEIVRANSILHTPRVPAAVWRAWRQFEQQASERLRSGALLAPPTPPPPIKTVEIKPAAGASVAPGVPGSKSINSLFVEAARSLVPAELVERINRAAEAARQNDSTMGFMKHFRRIAESELEPALLKQVTEEASRRLASPERWRTRRGRGQSSAAA